MADEPEYDEMEYVDESIRSVVLALNRLPGVETYSSCGGHPHAKRSQVREGKFTISFNLAPDRTGLRSLARITQIASDCSSGQGKPYHSLQVTAWYNGAFEGFCADCLSFQISGTKAIDREQLAGELNAVAVLYKDAHNTREGSHEDQAFLRKGIGS